MQQVITSKQAKQITGGRTPLVPVQYEQAVKALAECISLDDAKTWADKSDALAAWAKIYRDDKVLRQAKILKLEAFRRMWILAEELYPRRNLKTGGTTPGARHALIKSGLNRVQADSARAIAKLSDAEFKKVISADRPPAPSIFRDCGSTPEWMEARRYMSNLRGCARRFSAKTVAMKLKEGEAKLAKQMVVELQEWLDEFEQNLPKAK